MIIPIKQQTDSQGILEVTNMAVGPSAPPIIPTDVDSVPHPTKHFAKTNGKTNAVSFFIQAYSFVKTELG